MDPCPCPLGVSLGLGGGEVEDVDGVALGVVGGVFEGDFAFGDGVVGGRLHQAVDEDSHSTITIGRLGECNLGGEVHAVEDENRGIGEGDALTAVPSLVTADTYLPVSALPPVTDWSAPPMAPLTASEIRASVEAAVARVSVRDDQSSLGSGATTPSICLSLSFCIVFYFF